MPRRTHTTFKRPDMSGARKFTPRPGEISIGSADDFNLENAECPNPAIIDAKAWRALLKADAACRELVDTGALSASAHGSGKVAVRNETRGRLTFRLPDAPEPASTPPVSAEA